MPLVTCPDCQAAVSDVAPSCIHCGRPFLAAAPIAAASSAQAQVVYAKRTFNGVLGAAWLLGFSACGACSAEMPRISAILYGLAFLAWVASKFYTYG